MGRRGSMRGRPGFLLMTLFAIFLIIFYLSWRTLVTPESKLHDAYSVHRQSLFDESGKLVGKDESPRKKSGQDLDYNMDIKSAVQKKKDNAPIQHHFESVNGKDETTGKVIVISPLTPVVRPSESQDLKSDIEEFYHQPNDLIAETVASMERFVHLDLKGAAPKMTYLRLFIPLIKKLGATGLLIEYEDMFPYTGLLESVRARNAYSMNNIIELLKLAESFKLKVMPLIQTFGHMEYVLKSEFRHLRENDYTPQVIDITKNASYALIYEMVKQILNAHPHITHLHIGCDEVFELGKGASAVEMQSKKLSESQIFLQHVQRVARFVREQGGNNIIPVIWDDELRKMHSSDLEKSTLPTLVEIMVWQYTTNVLQFITKDVWDKYATVFKSVWIASSFKGATGARQMFTEPKFHVINHLSWLDVIATNNHLKFKGMALTGWQRYDHFATLCELLPVAIPSLAVCLATMINVGFTKEIHMAVSKLINCGSPIEMTFPKHGMKTRKAIISQDCRFPGRELYYAVHELYGYTTSSSASTNRVDGWLSDYQVAHRWSSPGQLKVLDRLLKKESSEYAMMSIPLKRHLAIIYFEDTVDEWMAENVQERMRRIILLQNKIRLLQQHKVWPLRPLLQTAEHTESSQPGNPYNENQNNPGSNSENIASVQLVSQTVQGKYEDANDEITTTQSSQNLSDNKFASAYPNQQNQLERKPGKIESDQKDIFSNYRPANGTINFKMYERKVAEEKFTKKNTETTHPRSIESNKQEGTFNGKESYDYKVLSVDQWKLKDINKKRKNMTIDKSNEDLNLINDTRDQEKKETLYMIPQRPKSTHVKNFHTQTFSNINSNVSNFALDDDKKKSWKDMMNAKIDERFQVQQEKSNSELQESFHVQVPHEGKSENVNHSSDKGFVKRVPEALDRMARTVNISNDHLPFSKKKQSKFVVNTPDMSHMNDNPESHVVRRFEIVQDDEKERNRNENVKAYGKKLLYRS